MISSVAKPLVSDWFIKNRKNKKRKRKIRKVYI